MGIPTISGKTFCVPSAVVQVGGWADTECSSSLHHWILKAVPIKMKKKKPILAVLFVVNEMMVISSRNTHRIKFSCSKKISFQHGEIEIPATCKQHNLCLATCSDEGIQFKV